MEWKKLVELQLLCGSLDRFIWDPTLSDWSTKLFYGGCCAWIETYVRQVKKFLILSAFPKWCASGTMQFSVLPKRAKAWVGDGPTEVKVS